MTVLCATLARSYEEMSDEELLVHYAQTDDEDAFAQLAKRFEPGISRVFQRSAVCRRYAEDLTQETFLKISRFSHQYDPSHDARDWILQIANRVGMQHKRQLFRKKRCTGSLDLCFSDLIHDDREENEAEKDHEHLDPVDHRTPPSELPITIDELRQAQQYLPSDERTLLSMIYCDGKSYADVADALQIRRDEAHRRAELAKWQLRRLLDPSAVDRNRNHVPSTRSLK